MNRTEVSGTVQLARESSPARLRGSQAARKGFHRLAARGGRFPLVRLFPDTHKCQKCIPSEKKSHMLKTVTL